MGSTKCTTDGVVVVTDPMATIAAEAVAVVVIEAVKVDTAVAGEDTAAIGVEEMVLTEDAVEADFEATAAALTNLDMPSPSAVGAVVVRQRVAGGG
jgi:hypothetical protein